MVHFLHSMGNIHSPFHRRALANSSTVAFASYRVPTYTPGSRAAMWIKCLAEGQKYRGMAGIEPGLSCMGESSVQTSKPRHLHLHNVCYILMILIRSKSYKTLIPDFNISQRITLTSMFPPCSVSWFRFGIISAYLSSHRVHTHDMHETTYIHVD